MNSTSEPILKLIAAYFCGEELTAEEKKELTAWKDHTIQNQKLFDYYQDLFSRRERLAQWDKFRLTDEAKDRIFAIRRQKRNYIFRYLKYAAVVVPALIVSVWLLSRHSDPIIPLASVQQGTLQDIAPGRQKAKLVLENGEVYSLSDSSMSIKSHENIQISHGGILEYAVHDPQTKVDVVYHTLAVERGAEFQVVLPDGTKVWLNSDSRLKYPNVFNETTRKVYLIGEAFFEVAHDEKHPFIVNAGECAIQVLGTAFNVSSYQEDKEIVTTLVSGKVAYTVGGHQGELAPGEQCIYGKEAKIAKVEKVDVNQYISWKNGLFVFDHVQMEELARQISRWYDVEVVFPDQTARNVSFTGAMERYKPVSYLIQILNETNTVDCKLENNMLVFRKK